MSEIKKICIAAGHNYFVANNFDPGAVSGKLREADIVKATAKLLVPMLEKRGYEVLDVTPYNERFSSTKAAHTEKCRRVDDFNADLYMDIHINSFSSPAATGTEAIVYSTKSKSYPYATQIVKNISNNVGIRNRGVKVNTSFYALTLTKKPAMIIEGTFISNPNDMKSFTPEIYAKSIAEAFVDISVKVETPVVGLADTIYRVRKEWLDTKSQQGAFGNLQYAINKVLEVGSEYKVFDENGVQVYPDNIHWAKKHYDNLISKGFEVTDTDFDKELTLGNAYKLFDELTDSMNTHDELETEVEKEPEKEIEVVEILQLEYKRALKRGMKGEDVKRLQMALIKLGYDPKGIDGSFGGGCETAVKSFQRDYVLVVDGSAGPATYRKINELLNGPVPGQYRTIREYSSDVHIYDATGCFVDVELGQRRKLETVTAVAKDKLKEGKKLLAATNCGFYNFDASSEHLGMYIDEGLYYTSPSNSFIDFIYYKDGSTKIVNMHGYDQKVLSQLQKGAHWAIGTSYSLIQDGKINLENKEKFSHHKNREPRTLLGQKKDGSFIVVVVDGRRVGSLGVTAQQSANIMLKLGCYNAVNLDGGGSSTMVVVQNGVPKVVNKPSNTGGKERPVGSMLMIYAN